MSEIDKWDEAFEQRLTGFLKEHLAELLTSEGLSRPARVYEIELRERLVRVEEAIKHQGELIHWIFDISPIRKIKFRCKTRHELLAPVLLGLQVKAKGL